MYPMKPPASDSRVFQAVDAGAARQGGRRFQVRRSAVHGRGVFALHPLKAGEWLIEYTGERITWEEAVARHPHDPTQPTHTFYFDLDSGLVIDGHRGGNSSRWFNHGCDPNCEAVENDGRVFLHALRDIAVGEELLFDYALLCDERRTPALKRLYACHCGAPTCRGTMLAPQRRRAARHGPKP